MPRLSTAQDFRPLQKLGFCYLCEQPFVADEERNRDHVPPQAVFLKTDRDPALWLPVHSACNHRETLDDEKIGQLIALRNGKVPTDPRNRRLKVKVWPQDIAAVVNLDVDAAVWRWIRGFHAALYGEPLPAPVRGALVTPFPRAPISDGPTGVEQLSPQHALFVSRIKLNRAFQTLDGISSNRGKLTYECIWEKSNGDDHWLCIFAINVYDWKDLGATGQYPARGCAGFYTLPSGARPPTATVGTSSALILPNRDALDPFSP